MDLKEMTFDQLAELKKSVEAEMQLVIEEEQNALQAKMAAMGIQVARPHTNGGPPPYSATPSQAKEKKKAPIKYQHPLDSTLTWSGRGLKPKWLNAEIEQGKTVEDFRIAP